MLSGSDLCVHACLVDQGGSDVGLPNKDRGFPCMRDIGCRVQGAGARSHGGMRAGANPFDLFVVLALSIMVASGRGANPRHLR